MKRTARFVDGQLVWDVPFTPEEEQRAAARFDAMVESGQVPGCMTDAVFLAGQSVNGSQFEGQEAVGDYYRREAKKAGVDVQGKTYLSGLAERPGDPKAWVTGRGDVQRVIEERGWSCNGAVEVKARTDVAPPAPIDLADDIVAEHVEKRLDADPTLARKPRGELAHEVKQSLLPDRKKRKV